MYLNALTNDTVEMIGLFDSGNTFFPMPENTVTRRQRSNVHVILFMTFCQVCDTCSAMRFGICDTGLAMGYGVCNTR